jgi:hypothetical protein
MLVVLRHRHRHLGDLMLLIAIHHTKIGGIGQIMAALTAPLREPVHLIIGLVDPGQRRARSSGLFTSLALRPASLPLRFLRRWRSAWIVVFGRRRRGILTVTRKQMLQPGQLRRQLLVGLQQIRNVRGQRRDLPILTPHESDQLFARHLLRNRHAEIKLRPGHPSQDQHAKINTFDPTPASQSCAARLRQDVRSSRCSSQSGLTDPPTFIPAFIIDKNLEQTGQFQALGHRLDHIP